MVECELLLFYKVPERRSSFNRYMVECESRSSTAILVAVIVLIDTWWNVNKLPLKILAFAGIVLIDTWWNVNLTSSVDICAIFPVLIDTWWNVN